MNKKGFTLLISIITTSLLLLVSFVVINVALKQLLISSSGQASQHAFYAADSGVECAMYWDLKNGAKSAFDISTAGTITCNNQTVTTGSQSIPAPKSGTSVVGGAASSIFTINFPDGCAIVQVTKSGTATTINSYGYDTCSASAGRRYERGITLSY